MQWFTNSSLAEQKKAILRRLRTQAAFMKQTTFLWYLLFVVYCMNKLQREVNHYDGKCYWLAAPKSHIWSFPLTCLCPSFAPLYGGLHGYKLAMYPLVDMGPLAALACFA